MRRKPRYVDEETCTGCGNCAEVCPIEVSNPFDLGLSMRKAIYRFSAQSVPGAYAIEKRGIAPCRDACPTDQRAQGYIALVHQKRYADAYWAIRREHPFPSVCGRVCNHRCEEACSRGAVRPAGQHHGAQALRGRLGLQHRDELPRTPPDRSAQTNPWSAHPSQHNPTPTGKKIAIIGAGPAGLTAGLDLVRLGHSVTVFDSLPVAGGMMRVGIPPHRLPYERLDWEIQQIAGRGRGTAPEHAGERHPRVCSTAGLQRRHHRHRCPQRHRSWTSPVRTTPTTGSAWTCCGAPAWANRSTCAGTRSSCWARATWRSTAARTAVRLGSPKVKIVCRGMRAGLQRDEVRSAAEGMRDHQEPRLQGSGGQGRQDHRRDAAWKRKSAGIVNGQRQVQRDPRHRTRHPVRHGHLGARSATRLFLPARRRQHRHPLPGRAVGQRRDDDHPARACSPPAMCGAAPPSSWWMPSARVITWPAAWTATCAAQQGLPEPKQPPAVELAKEEIAARRSPAARLHAKARTGIAHHPGGGAREQLPRSGYDHDRRGSPGRSRALRCAAACAPSAWSAWRPASVGRSTTTCRTR